MINSLNHLFIWILNMSITAGYCIAAVLLIRLLFRRAPRKYLYMLWLVVAFRLVCPVSMSTNLSLFNLEQFSGSRPVTEAGPMQYIPEQIIQTESPEVHAGSGEEALSVRGKLPEAGSQGKLTGILSMNLPGAYGLWPAGRLLIIGTYVWIAGAAVFLVYFSVSMFRLRRSVRMAVRAEEGRRSGAYGEWNVSCEIYECDHITSPFTMGIFHPRIYLPYDLTGEPRRMVLLHEQYHIRRKDHLVKLFAFLLLSVYWFHPLVWAAWFGMCKDMEMSCDEKVLELLGEGEKKAYSLTLLAFAEDRKSGSRMPLGFGEHDVKSRIRHSLSFKKPAVWAGVLAVFAIAAVLVVFGTNGVQREEDFEETAAGTYSETAQKLYENRNPYVGDASANGRLLGAIAEALPDTLVANARFTTELQTSEEPYGFCFVLEEVPEGEPYQYSVAAPAALLLALTDNLGVVEFRYQTAGGSSWEKWTAQQAAKWCGAEDLKEYGSSPEKVQELLDLIAVHQKDDRLDYEWSIHGESEAEEDFMEGYAVLPYELYENALTLKEYNALSVYDRERMVVLAQTDNQTVTVYGYWSPAYGCRGITVDYKIVPGGDSNHTYLDYCWIQSYDYKLVLADYDRDGRDEIAFTMAERQGMNATEEQLILFETHDTGTLEPHVFSSELKKEELDNLVAVSVDTGNHQVHVVRRGSESSVPLLSISYGPDETVTAVDLLRAVSFELGEELYMYAAVGMRMGDSTLVYGRGNDWTERLLRFRVIYEDSDDLSGGYFTLTDVGIQEEADGGVKTLQQ